MTKFLIKIFTFILLLIILVLFLLSLPATPRASKSLLFAQIKKDSLLINKSVPRLILVGGSNLSFGINSQIIKDSLKVNPINTGIHYAQGLEFMLKNTIQYVKSGDIIILAPEYNQFFGSVVYGEEELLRTLADVRKNKLIGLSRKQILNISKYLAKYCVSKLKYSEYFNFKESDIYSVNSFNKCSTPQKHRQWLSSIFESLKPLNNENHSSKIHSQVQGSSSHRSHQRAREHDGLGQAF